jgi:hypothetical protein
MAIHPSDIGRHRRCLRMTKFSKICCHVAVFVYAIFSTLARLFYAISLEFALTFVHERTDGPAHRALRSHGAMCLGTKRPA